MFTAVPMSVPTVERAMLSDDLYGYRYPVPREFVPNIMASEEERWESLASIGIGAAYRTEGKSSLDAWRDAVADCSGIERARLDPKLGGALDLGFSPAHVRKFVFYLA